MNGLEFIPPVHAVDLLHRSAVHSCAAHRPATEHDLCAPVRTSVQVTSACVQSLPLYREGLHAQVHRKNRQRGGR